MLLLYGWSVTGSLPLLSSVHTSYLMNAPFSTASNQDKCMLYMQVCVCVFCTTQSQMEHNIARTVFWILTAAVLSQFVLHKIVPTRPWLEEEQQQQGRSPMEQKEAKCCNIVCKTLAALPVASLSGTSHKAPSLPSF